MSPKDFFFRNIAPAQASPYGKLLAYLRRNPDLSVSGNVANHQRYSYNTAPDLTLTVEGTLATGDDWDSDPELGKLADEVQEAMEDWCHAFNKEMEKTFYKELEYRQSEEALAETWEANEVRFDEDGDMISRVVNGRRVRQGLEFSQLSPEAKAHALEKYRNWDTEDNAWSEFLEDDFKQQLEYMGFNRVEIEYSLNYSQGDGACFTSSSIDVPKFLEKITTGKKPTDVFNEAKSQAAVLVRELLV